MKAEIYVRARKDNLLELRRLMIRQWEIKNQLKALKKNMKEWDDKLIEIQKHLNSYDILILNMTGLIKKADLGLMDKLDKRNFSEPKNKLLEGKEPSDLMAFRSKSAKNLNDLNISPF